MMKYPPLKLYIFRILSDLVCHGGNLKEDSAVPVPSANCNSVKLEVKITFVSYFLIIENF